ncbi:hypothetical protein ABMD26_003591 [Pseudomonas sp. PvP001]
MMAVCLTEATLVFLVLYGTPDGGAGVQLA